MNLQQILLMLPVVIKAAGEIQALVNVLKENASKAGATPEQLADLDARLTDAIAAREAELRAAETLDTP